MTRTLRGSVVGSVRVEHDLLWVFAGRLDGGIDLLMHRTYA
jgi:hypothetical protein